MFFRLFEFYRLIERIIFAVYLDSQKTALFEIFKLLFKLAALAPDNGCGYLHLASPLYHLVYYLVYRLRANFLSAFGTVRRAHSCV